MHWAGWVINMGYYYYCYYSNVQDKASYFLNRLLIGWLLNKSLQSFLL